MLVNFVIKFFFYCRPIDLPNICYYCCLIGACNVLTFVYQLNSLFSSYYLFFFCIFLSYHNELNHSISTVDRGCFFFSPVTSKWSPVLLLIFVALLSPVSDEANCFLRYWHF